MFYVSSVCSFGENAPFFIKFSKIFKTLLKFIFIFSSPQLKAHMWAISLYQCLWHPLSIVCQNFQTSSLKPLGQFNSNFIWRLLRVGERKFAQMFPVTWPRWPPSWSYKVKTLWKSSSLEPKGQWPLYIYLVCSIGNVDSTKFAQMMIQGWPWPTLQQGKIW